MPLIVSHSGVLRLFQLVTSPLWHRDDAAFILAGVDPKAPLLSCDAPHERYVGKIAWLADARPPEWEALADDPLAKRAVHRVLMVRHMLWMAPSMTPFAWLSEGLRRGIEPPWLAPFAKELESLWKAFPPANFGEMPLLPVGRRHATKNSRAKHIVRILWEAWQFDERRFGGKAELISAAQSEIDDVEVDSKVIRQWIDQWGRESGARYSVSSRSIILWDPLEHAS